MSLAMGLAFERGIGFGFVFVSASDPAAYGAEEIASLDAVPTLVFRLGSCLVQFGYLMQGAGGASLAHRSRPSWAQRSPVGTSKGCGSLPLLFCVPFRR